MLSNGEFVVNQRATSKYSDALHAINNEGNGINSILNNYSSIDNISNISNKTILPNNVIRTRNDQLKSIPVNGVTNNYTNNNINNGEIKLSINISGSMDVKSDGYSTTISGRDLLNDQNFISHLIKEIQIKTDYALNKDKLNNKFYSAF